MVTLFHWVLCKAADRAYTHPPPKRVRVNARILQTLATPAASPYDNALVKTAYLATALC